MFAGMKNISIPKIKGRGAKLKYPFDKVTEKTPQKISFTTPAQRRSIIAAAFNYGKLHDIKFTTRTNGGAVTVYRTK